MPRWWRSVQPWQVVLAFLLLYLGTVFFVHGKDPSVFVTLGHGPNEGYDGQFTYLLAVNPDRDTVVHEIRDVRADVPAYRYQRILLPLLARAVATGDATALFWTIPGINLAAHTLATLLVARLLSAHGVNQWYALIYGMWPGLLLGVRAGLTEPLSFALVAAAYALQESRRGWLSPVAFGLALFAKETALLFVAAQMTSAAFRASWGMAAGLLTVACLPFLLWQIALRSWFGEFGIGTGGYLATSFEVVPFNGLWRIAMDDVGLFVVFLVIFGPTIVLPSLWGLTAAARECVRGNWHPYVVALAAHALTLPFTPFSTFREPGGLLRFATGLVLSTLLFAAITRSSRVLRWSPFWMVLLIFLRE